MKTLEYVRTWEHGHHFTERQKEYLALSAIKFGAGLYKEEEEKYAHDQLTWAWENLEGYDPEERVIMLTQPSGSPAVQTILKGVGRPVGYSPINGDGGAMVKKSRAWSMPEDGWDWLEAQPNQSETIRKALSSYRKRQWC